MACAPAMALMQIKVPFPDRGHVPIMSKHARMLIVIADGEHARFVRAAANGALHTASSFDSAVAQQRSSDLGSDRPGAAFHSNATVHHALAARSDPHALAEQGFAHLVASEIDAAFGRHEFDELLLTAPPRILNAIRDRLSAGSVARLAGMLRKDLAKTPDDALRPHLRRWLDAPPPAA